MTNDNLMPVWFAIAVLCAFAAAAIAHGKNRQPGWPAALGFFLGVIGLVIVAVLPSKPPAGWRKVVCPRCKASQNAPSSQATYECWQCKRVAPTPWTA